MNNHEALRIALYICYLMYRYWLFLILHYLIFSESLVIPIIIPAKHSNPAGTKGNIKRRVIINPYANKIATLSDISTTLRANILEAIISSIHRKFLSSFFTKQRIMIRVIMCVPK